MQKNIIMEQLCPICKESYNRRAKTCSKKCQAILTNETFYEKRKCEHCEKEFSVPIKKKNEDKYALCGICRKYKKICSICKKLHYNQGLTCSKECAYELKKETWKNSCGSYHNFCKNSTSRKDWENKLLKDEGITNVFQRESVKSKIIKTIFERYGSRVNDTKKIFCNISHTPLWREKHHANYIKVHGLDSWLDKEENNSSEKKIYIMNVWEITISQLNCYSKNILGKSLFEIKEYNIGKKFRDKLSIDHKFSISNGFDQKISPLIIGSIYNLEYILTCVNSSKGPKNSITLEDLLKKYNENNIDS